MAWIRAWNAEEPEKTLGKRADCGNCPIWTYVTNFAGHDYQVVVQAPSVEIYASHIKVAAMRTPHWARNIIQIVDRGMHASCNGVLDHDSPRFTAVTAREIAHMIDATDCPNHYAIFS